MSVYFPTYARNFSFGTFLFNSTNFFHLALEVFLSTLSPSSALFPFLRHLSSSLLSRFSRGFDPLTAAPNIIRSHVLVPTIVSNFFNHSNVLYNTVIFNSLLILIDRRKLLSYRYIPTFSRLVLYYFSKLSTLIRGFYRVLSACAYIPLLSLAN